MRVALIDVDGHNQLSTLGEKHKGKIFPNTALMKISAYHKSIEDQVEMFFPMMHYDKVYMSKIFDFTPDFETVINADEIIRGGRAYDKKLKLPPEVESMYPDYFLYGVKEAYGQLTRGCPRGCDFCDVKNIEGQISYKVADLKQFWKDQKDIKLLDPNILAAKERIELLQQLIDSKAYVDFTQGLDARLLTNEVIHMIKQIKIRQIHFAWDKMDFSDIIVKNLAEFKKQTGINHRKLGVYVLVNFNTTMEENLYRIYKLKELGYDPYVMIYDKHKLPRGHILKKLQRWVNNKIIFRSGSAETFEEYLKIK